MYFVTCTISVSHILYLLYYVEYMHFSGWGFKINNPSWSQNNVDNKKFRFRLLLETDSVS